MPRRSELTLRRYVSRGNGRGSAASRPEQVVLVVVVDVEPQPAVERDSGGVLGRDLEVGAARPALCRPPQGRDAHRRAEPSTAMGRVDLDREQPAPTAVDGCAGDGDALGTDPDRGEPGRGVVDEQLARSDV